MLISLKFPEGVAFQPIMSNLEEKIIEETTPIRENLWETRKASISCHYTPLPKGYDTEGISKPLIRDNDHLSITN
jgi:hypothetical protein